MQFDMQMQELKPGTCLVHLPKQCQLTYDSQTQPELLELIEQVPAALWGARLALQVCDLPALVPHHGTVIALSHTCIPHVQALWTLAQKGGNIATSATAVQLLQSCAHMLLLDRHTCAMFLPGFSTHPLDCAEQSQ